MAYSLERIPNAPYEIPPPPPYAVWVEDTVWDYQTRTRVKDKGQGQIRHMPDLAKAKERVRRYAVAGRWASEEDQGKFDSDWAVYLWNAEKGEYELQYDGKTGESWRMNELFHTRAKKGERTPRAGLEDEVEAALASIASVVR